jgi:hypothetical protein
VIDRDNRENWMKAGAPDTNRRAIAEVERRLAAYEPVHTDPAAVAELQRIIRAGLTEQTDLPFVPPPASDAGQVAAAAAGAAPDAPRGRRPNPRRGR